MIPYVDTHCHLDLIKDIQKNTSAEDIQSIKTISVTNAPFLFSANQKLFQNCKNIRIALGMHPELISSYSDQLNEFVKHLNYTKYIGEIGIDGSKDFQNSYNLQRTIFEQILDVCKYSNEKILTVHSRNAVLETITLLNKYLKNSTCRVILHWFSGTLSELEIGLQSGFYFSINHKMVSTVKGTELIKNIPLDRLLTETDAPFTFTGQVNTRLKSLITTINGIANIKKKSSEEIKSIVYYNFKNVLL